MDPKVANKLLKLYREGDNGDGRPLSELIKTKDMLKGVESQRLRSFFTSECMEPHRDLDVYGWLIFSGDLEGLQQDFESCLNERKNMGKCSEEEAHRGVAEELSGLRWGPTEVPIYDLLLLCTLIQPKLRDAYLAITRWMSTTAKVPVDGTDLSGTTALAHAISTKPGFDPVFAQILYDAGGDINHLNRYRENAAGEILKVFLRTDLPRAVEALRWFLSHGGNVDVKDGDGVSPRMTLDGVMRRISGAEKLVRVVEREDRRRKEKRETCCAFCGRDDVEKLMVCSRCRKAKYCDPKARACQKVDWARHKAECQA